MGRMDRLVGNRDAVELEQTLAPWVIKGYPCGIFWMRKEDPGPSGSARNLDCIKDSKEMKFALCKIIQITPESVGVG